MGTFLFVFNAMNLFATITKTEETPEGLIVEGIASTERVDSEGEIVDYDSLKACLPDYSQWNNIREMHQASAVGKALVVTANDADRSVLVRALIVDDNAARKVRTGVYKGYSIGGKADRKVIKVDGATQTRAYMKLLSEISLADRPANPDAKITLFKAEGVTMADEPQEESQTPDALAKVKELADKAKPTAIKKASADPSKIVPMCQIARNEAELAGDLDAAQLWTQAIGLIMQASGDADEDAADNGADEGSEAPPTDATDPSAVAFAQKAGNVKKVGRPMSGSRLAMLRTAAKALAQMGADAGDEICAAALKAFGADTAAADDSAPLQAAAKAIQTSVDAMNSIATVVMKLYDDVNLIKKQPAPGGPTLRVNKTLGTDQGGNVQADESTVLKSLIDKTSDPLAKQALSEQLAVIETRRAMFGR